MYLLQEFFKHRNAAFVALLLVLFFINSCRHRSDAPFTTANPTSSAGQPEPLTEGLLQYLPPVLSVYSNNDTATSIILTTADVARFDNKKEELSYNQSLQIVDADAPWPPRWYSSPAYFTDEMYAQITGQQQYRFDMTIDAKVEAGYFSFYKILSQQKTGVGQLEAPSFAGYILLNEKFEAVDTVNSKEKGFNMYFHDLRINADGEKMVDAKKNVKLDLRRYSNQQKDSAVNCNVDYIQILDKDNNPVFTWDPIKNLDPDIFQFKETLAGKAFAARHADVVEWTRLTSAFWDYDGNIMYAMKKIGIGKVSRADGHVIWQINHSDLPIYSGKDTIEWFDPHDFNMLSHNDTAVVYSLFSNGSGAKRAAGVVFEMNKKTQKVKLIKHIPSRTNYVADGQGNIEYFANGDYAMGYGFFEKSDSIPGYRNVLEYQLANGKFGVYQLPQWNYTYKARLLRNWPRPARPVITKDGDWLTVSGSSTNWTWYKLSGAQNRTVVMVGKGNKIKPEKGARYCVEGNHGIGNVVSRIFLN